MNYKQQNRTLHLLRKPDILICHQHSANDLQPVGGRVDLSMPAFGMHGGGGKTKKPQRTRSEHEGLTGNPSCYIRVLAGEAFGFSQLASRKRFPPLSQNNPAEDPTHSMFRLWSTPIISPRPMRRMVSTGVSSSTQMYIIRTSTFVPPNGVSMTGSKCSRA